MVSAGYKVTTCEVILKSGIIYISLNFHIGIALDADSWVTCGSIGGSNAPEIEKTFPIGGTNGNLKMIGKITTEGNLQIKSVGTAYLPNSPMVFTICYSI